MNIAFLTPGAFGLKNGNGGIGLYNRDIVDGLVEALPDAKVTLLQRLLDPDHLDEIADTVSRALAKPKEIPEGLDYFSWPHFVARLKATVEATMAGPR